MQGMEDVDEGHPETSGNADVPEEIVSLEQVTLSKDNEYVTIMKPFFCLQHHFLMAMSSKSLFFVTSALTLRTFPLTFAVTYSNVSQLVPGGRNQTLLTWIVMAG